MRSHIERVATAPPLLPPLPPPPLAAPSTPTISPHTVRRRRRGVPTRRLELVASLKRAVGDLDRVKRIVKVNGFIAVSDASVTNLPVVLNGCSNLLGEIFEERGVHARVAVGVTSLPLGVPVEIDLIAQVE